MTDITSTPQLAQSIITRRSELGLSQQALSNLSGVSKPTIQRFETGKHWINTHQLTLICQAMGVELVIKEI